MELEHQIGTELETPYFEDSYRTEQGSPDIHFGKKDPSCRKECNKALSFDGRKKLTFSKSARLMTSSRYIDRSFAIVKEYIEATSDYRFYFVSSLSFNKSSSYRSSDDLCRGLSMGITHEGALVCLTDEQIMIYQKPNRSDDNEHMRVIELPAEANIGVINNNLAGNMAIALINTEQQQLYYTELDHLLMQNGDISAWRSHETLIHDRSDYRDVLAVYPKNSSRGVVAAYEYVNVLNKNTTIYDFDGESVNRRIITNNINGNFGLKPEVFFYNQQAIFTAKSSDDGNFHSYRLTEQDLKMPQAFYSEHDQQSRLDFLAGYSLTYNNWSMSQSAGDGIKTEYDIDSSFLQTVYLQARLVNTQLTLKYLTNEVKEATSGPTSYLTGLVDFNGFFKGADTLRLKVDWAKINGVATYKSSDYQLNNESQVSSRFSSEYKNFEILIFSEMGQYIGLSYSTNAMPSAISLSTSEDSATPIGWAFDEDYKQTSYMLKIGSNEAAYGARYELDYSRAFFRPSLGIGLVDRQISDAAIKEATTNTSIKSVTGELSWVALLGVDMGYTYQRRWDEYKGIGYSVQTGIRAEMYYQGESYETSDSDELYVNMERLDFNWGPYVQFNAIF
jgi:hypothetical protein